MRPASLGCSAASPPDSQRHLQGWGSCGTEGHKSQQALRCSVTRTRYLGLRKDATVPLGWEDGEGSKFKQLPSSGNSRAGHTHKPETRAAASGRRLSAGLGRPLMEPAVRPESRAPKDRRVTTSQRRKHQAPRTRERHLATLRHPHPRQERQAVCICRAVSCLFYSLH